MPSRPYGVAWRSAARRSLSRPPEKIGTATIEFIYGSLAQNPQRVGKPLKLELDGLHSARRGTYRVVYRIDEAAHIVTVLAVGHRADVYRSL